MEAVAGSGLLASGAISQACAATRQWRKTCRSSSTPSHVLQLKDGIPRDAKLELTGIAFLASFHRKSLIFGEVLMFHMFFSQLNEAMGESLFPAELIPAPYPVLWYMLPIYLGARQCSLEQGQSLWWCWEYAPRFLTYLFCLYSKPLIKINSSYI